MHRIWALAWSLLVIAACSPSGPPAERFAQGPWVETAQGYSIRGWSRWIPGTPNTVVFGATIANRGNQPVVFRSGCEPRVRAYRTPQRAGTPAWDSHPEGQLCLEGRRVPLAPGDALLAAYSIVVATVPKILGDSLAEGWYFFTVSPPTDLAARPPLYGPPSPEEDSLPKYWIYVPAGSLHLKRR
jgi:hypothetical protein